MDTASVGLFVTKAGAVPPSPVSLKFSSLAPEVFAKILAATGMELREQRTPEGEAVFLLRTVNTEMAVAATPTSTPAAAATLHFLVEKLDTKVAQVVAAGASVLQEAHLSSWGRRAILCDPDGRRIILTERTSLGSQSPPETQQSSTGGGSIVNSPPFTVEGRDSVAIHCNATALSLLGAIGETFVVPAIGLTTKYLGGNRTGADHTMLFAAAACLFLSMAGKAVCLLDKGRLVEARNIVIAVGLNFVTIGTTAYLVVNVEMAAGMLVLGAICQMLSMIFFLEYIGEVGTAIQLPALKNAASRSVTTWMMTFALLFLAVMATCFGMNQVTGVFLIGAGLCTLLAIALNLILFASGTIQLMNALDRYPPRR